MLNGLLQLIYPRNCLWCKSPLNREERYFCLTCENELPRYELHTNEHHPMKSAIMGRIPAEVVWSYLVFRKDNATQVILHQIKYLQEKDLALHMGKMMGVVFHQLFDEMPFDWVIPVPLHPRKKAIRGFNQSELIAKGFSEKTGIALNHTSLSRVNYGPSQTQKNRTERWENVAASFTLKDSSKLENSNILLLDDVFTTGATMEACWTELEKAKPHSIGLLSLAFTE